MDEFALIGRYFASQNDAADVLLGIGDDAALVRVAADQNLALATDTLVAGVHFPHDIAPGDLGYRLSAVNLSDMAAMGARPRFATLALTLPAVDHAWLESFSDGLKNALGEAGVSLVGGDTTRGPLTLTLQLVGTVPAAALCRSGARPGDLVFVSGTLGDARAGLDALRGDSAAEPELRARYFRPQARVELGCALLGIATAAIDVSDGLLADLDHVAEQSQVAMEIDPDSLPLSEHLSRYCDSKLAQEYAATGGDDYELAFTIPAAREADAIALGARLGVSVTRIGRVMSGVGVRCVDRFGKVRAFGNAGYRHFT